MKNILVFFFISISASFSFGQTAVNNFVVEAKAKHQSGDLDGTRFALYQALAELDKEISLAILADLPTTLGGLDANTEKDSYTGMHAGILQGVYVIRYFGNIEGEKSITLNIIDNSPLIGGLNTFLNSPLGAMVTGRKMIKIDGFKGVLEQNENYDLVYDVNVPLSGESLLTLEYKGFTEAEVMSISKSLKLKTIHGYMK